MRTKVPSRLTVEGTTTVVDKSSAASSSIDTRGAVERHDHRTLTRRFRSLIAGAVLVDIAIVVALTRIGMLGKPHFASLNSSMLDRVNAILPVINTSMDSFTNFMTVTERKSVGLLLAEQGANAKYSIVMIPGFVSSGLDVWAGKDCAKGFFRRRLWAAFSGARTFLVERDCWKEHLMLDPFTGGDPIGIRVRASEGFAATDYFIANYWVWGKLIENLADVGYTPSNMVMHPYDWRLPFALLEKRDGYFTTLRYRIEAIHKTSGRKIALVSHSMGALVVHHFFGWVTASETRGGGGGGKDWVDKHVGVYINIAGPHLGVPKATTALLSGEMSDTVFGGTMTHLVEGFFGRRMRRDLWSSWGSLWAMLPMGGTALWGSGVDFCLARSSMDRHCPNREDSMSPLIVMTDMHKDSSTFNVHVNEPKYESSTLASQPVYHVGDVLNILMKSGNGMGPGTYNSLFLSNSINPRTQGDTWHDATQSPLPHAPSMKIFCLYGTGHPTERAYYYKRNWDEQSTQEVRQLSEPAIVIDTVNDEKQGIRHGIRFSDGDGSVPLLSLGYICVDAWKRKESGLNPSKSKVYTREYLHKPTFSADDPMRGGPMASDHVGILGNSAMIEDLINIVTDFEPKGVTKDHIVSDIGHIAAGVNAQILGGALRTKSVFHRLTTILIDSVSSKLKQSLAVKSVYLSTLLRHLI